MRRSDRRVCPDLTSISYSGDEIETWGNAIRLAGHGFGRRSTGAELGSDLYWVQCDVDALAAGRAVCRERKEYHKKWGSAVGNQHSVGPDQTHHSRPCRRITDSISALALTDQAINFGR
jgi:hypothetical protein